MKNHVGNTIFTDEFPEIKNNQELEKVKEKYKNYDPYYIAAGCIKDRRKKFDGLWQIYRQLADSHFLSDVKKHFHQRTWEMYLGVIFLKNKLNTTSSDSGPDFVINNSEKIFIEAVACEKGETRDKVPDIIYNGVQNIPHDEMLIRLANSLDSKYKKYKEFIQRRGKAYVIAINKGALEHPDPEIPLILKCLFGIGFQHFKKINGRLTYADWTSRKFIKKNNQVQVPMNFFEDPNHNIVSAVIYSNKIILNCFDNIGSDCIVVHNPNAVKPISLEVFSFLKQYQANYDNDGLNIKRIK